MTAPRDPYRYFRIEAVELLDGMARAVLELERRVDAQLVSKVLRFAHTLKGAARIVKHAQVAQLAHELEDLLVPLAAAPVVRPQQAAIALIDRMSAAIAALPAVSKATTPTPASPPPMALSMHADVGTLDDILAGIGELHGLVGRLRDGGDPRRLADQLERELTAVRHDAETLRHLPASSMFGSLARIARDTAVALGKEVELVTEGLEFRLDPQMLSAIHGALVQLVRNAVAHGIELPAVRRAAGKPTSGRVTIAVMARAGRACFECRDDGGGIDLAAVERAAVARGLAPGATREALLELLLGGGLSTRAEVTEIAGRGIGLDLARTAARDLGGTLVVTTGAAGTTIALAVPMMTTAVPALIVYGGDRAGVIPLAVIRRVERIDPAAVVRGPAGATIQSGDAAIPMASLATLLGGTPGTATSVVIVERDGLAAIAVDRLGAIDKLILRAFPPGTPVAALLWGVAVDASGTPIPVFEAGALVIAARASVDPIQPAAIAPLPILVVDDSLTTRMLERSILEAAGYQVDLASSAEEALDKVAARRYGIVLVDVEMPGMDGFQFVTELRARPALAQLPAILVTSRDALADRQRGVTAGAQGYVVKGEFDQTQLVGLIRRLAVSA